VEKSRFSNPLINWYKKHKRDLPWRESQDSYRIWLSEVLLQQTRVAQGLPYYLRFLECFPDIKALANAPEKEVLRVWQGLGYYSRARNLHSAAKTIVSEHGGVFPSTYSGLLQLKGIGSYTAAAIASFAYNQPVAVLDGNVFRVLARVFGLKENIASPKGKKTFQALADSLLPIDNAATYNQAIMEFGALQCTPKNPVCSDCPLSFMCYAYAKNEQAVLPVKIKTLKKTVRYFHYLVLQSGPHYLMKERTGKDIWQGLYDFPLLEKKGFIEIGKLLSSEFKPIGKKLEIKLESKPYKHLLSHQTLHVKFWVIQSAPLVEYYKKEEKFRLYSLKNIHGLPKPVLINKFLEESLF
jgi:A/G-specific adenine glycosylase